MKDKLIRFCKEKREIIAFIAIMLVLFSTVIIIAELTNKKDILPVDNVIEEKEPEQKEIEEPVKEKVVAPLKGDYLIVREFYDLNKNDLTKAVFSCGNTYIVSKGVGFSKSDNKPFDCLNIIDGTVLDVKKTDTFGYVVTVDNLNGLVTTFYNLSDVLVKQGDKLNQLDKIGVSGNSLIDTQMGNNVFVEMKLDNTYLDLQNYISKDVEEVYEYKK